MASSTISRQVQELRQRQLRQWPLVRDNYAALEQAQLRELWLGDSLVVLQHNPERRRSAAARVDAAALAARPCFLCREHQPAEQETVEWGSGRYKIQVNPYPIFPVHLTVSASAHTPQSLADPGRITDMLALAHDLPDCVVFYNGPQCGASAPDHFHFQAGSMAMLPLCAEVADDLAWPDECRLEGNEEGFIAFSQRFGRFLFFIKTATTVQAQLYFARLQLAMMLATGQAGEPMQNLLCWIHGGDCCLAVFPRRKHRPACYGEGEGQLLLSPASTEMGGLWAVASDRDYGLLDAQRIQALYDELCVDAAAAVAIIDNYFKTKQLNNG
ncbi:MAG: DUF4922 domain-containing protein [Muribaculaceae bacterium]|nr:DUF4922 domain-containing protein [Muribaculaceae bacterium]